MAKQSTDRYSPAPISSDYLAAVYTCLSLLVVMLMVLLAYVLCSKRYRLNWFEKTLLEGNNVLQRGAPIQAATTPVVPLPLPPVPPIQQTPLLQRQASVCHSDVSGDDSVPGTPNTPLGLSLGGPASPFAVEQGVALRFVQPQVSGGGTTGARTKRTSMQTKLDHTKINAAMYQKHTVRTPSLPEDMRGSLRFSLIYEPEPGSLRVRLIQATDLMAPGTGDGTVATADPYARLLLLPDTSVQRKSAVHENTLQPVFDEELTFAATPTQLVGRVLQVLIYDFDRNSRHRCMGSVKLALDRIDLSEKITLWKGISQCDEKDDQVELGELMVSLGYLPSAERLTVVVLGARNLRPADEAKKSSDPYVKVCLLRAGKRVKKKKTSTRRGTLEPVFDEALAFDVAKELLPAISFEFTVVHDNMLGPNEFLGRVLIGQESKGEQAEHYLDVLRMRPAVARWHSLVAGNVATTF